MSAALFIPVIAGPPDMRWSPDEPLLDRQAGRRGAATAAAADSATVWRGLVLKTFTPV